MYRFLIILLLLAGSSLFAVEAFALEVEIQKESDRIIEARGWLTPEQHSFQEQFKIIIDETNSKSRFAIGMLSTDPRDIIFTDEIESLGADPRVHGFTFTNQFACAPEKTERACVIIEIVREGLGNDINEIKKNSREITDELIGDIFLVFETEFDSVELKSRTNLDGEEVIVSEVLYTIDKERTDTLFNALGHMFISTNITDAGGFFDNAEKLTEHNFSELTLTFTPLENKILRSLHISLTCSDVQRQLPQCPLNFDEQLENGIVDPLELLQVESISRSKIFANEFLPLNSIIHVMVFSDHNLEADSINSNVIEKLHHLGNVQENGWFFTSKSGNMIDARYIFATDASASKNDLMLSIGGGSNIEMKSNENGGGCLIATAAFGSELSPQIQFLREIRDNTVLQTKLGTSFMTSFNQFYYSFSPTIADYERENPAFKEVVKLTLTPLLASLTLLQYADIDSESEMLGYGISIILLNIGMYFVAPAVLITKVRKKI